MPERNSERHPYRKYLYKNYVSGKSSIARSSSSTAEYQQWGQAASQRLAGWLPKDLETPVLDIGCGSGRFLYLLGELGYTNLTGIDISSEQIVLARQRCPKATILEGDLCDLLKQSPGRFGLITGFDIIEHFHKDESLEVLTLIYQALRPEGQVILQTPNGESPWMGAVAYGDFTHEWFYTSASLAELLRLVGFTDFEARPSGPFIHGVPSLVRYIVWKGINGLLKIWNLAETGGYGSGIYSRVFLATAKKQG